MSRAFQIENITTHEFDYNFLMGQLKGYADPWGKISELLKQNKIIRVKKGLYILGPSSKSSTSLMTLANMIFGPSYVSREFALSHYGLIPERVHILTSVTPKRHKVFDTPVGVFDYAHLPMNAYNIGYQRVELDPSRAYLIASPEKALADLVSRLKPFENIHTFRDYLSHDLRIDTSSLRDFSLARIQSIASRFRLDNVRYLFSLVGELK